MINILQKIKKREKVENIGKYEKRQMILILTKQRNRTKSAVKGVKKKETKLM